MNIGRLKIDIDGSVYFADKHIGHVSSMSLRQSGKTRHGNIGIKPDSREISFTEVALELAEHGFSTTFDFYGQFWPNSFARNGQWLAEIQDGNRTVVVPLNIAAPIKEEAEYDVVADSY